MNARRRRLTIFLLIVIPITVLLSATVFYIINQVRHTVQHLDVILVEQIEKQTNRAVEVGKVDVSPLKGTATVHDLRIANGKSFKNGSLLETKRVIINFRLRDIVFGRVPAIQSVDSVRLISPAIRLERFRNGRLNISDLFKRKPGPRRPPFIGVVDISDGTLIFRDWLSRTPGSRPIATRTANINGTFDASNAPFYEYNLTAKGPGKKLFSTVSISGSIDNTAGVIAADIAADNAAASYWMDYFIKQGAVRVRSGRGDVRLSLTGRLVKGRRIWSYAGSADIRNAQAVVSGLRKPANNINGRIRLVNQTLDFNLTGSITSSQMRMTGTMAGFAAPRFDLHITSGSFDYSSLITAFEAPANLNRVRITGKGPLSLDIIGPSKHIVIAARGRIPSVGFNGYRAADISLRAAYADRVILVQSASARALNGRITAFGSVTLINGAARLALSGTGSGVELSRIPQLSKSGLRGAATGRFTVSGLSSSPVLDANVQVSRGTLNNIVYSDAIARLTISDNRVSVRSIAASVASGVIRATGEITPTRLNIRASAVGVDLSILQRPLGLTGYRGIVNFNGSVTGLFSKPVVNGSAEVFNGQFQRFAFDYARGRLIANSSGIILEDAVVRVLPAEIALRGRITGIGTPSPAINFDIEVVEAPAERILSVLQVNAAITGDVTGRVTIRGTAPNITAMGTLKLTDGSVAGYPVAQARAAFSYADKQLRLTDLLAQSDNAVFSADGMIDAKGNIAFNFIANNIALVQLSRYTQPYTLLSGTVDAKGHITGTADNPTVAATVVSNNPVINTVKFDRFAAEVGWSGKALVVADINLQSASGVLSVERAAFDTATRSVQVEGGVLKNFSYPVIYTAVSESPYIDQPAGEGLRSLLARLRRPDTGIISAAFNISGPVDEPEAKFSLTAQDVDISEIKNARIELSAVSRQGEVVLESFEATAEALSVSARGVLIANGQTDLEVDAYNVDLDALTPATGPTHIRGTATVRATVKGPIDTPLIMASAEVVNPVIYGIAFDRLRASQITVGRNSIEISRALVTRDEQSAAFYGTLPWDWQKFTIPTDQPIAFHAALEEQTLEVLTLLSDAVTADPKYPGRISATLDLTGSVSNPDLSGQMAVKDGNINIKDFQTQFTNIQANLVFDQDLVRVESLSGGSSGGGTFDVVPGGTISLHNLFRPAPGSQGGVVNLVFNLNNLKLIEQNLLGYQERVTGTFSTVNSLAVSGAVTEPLISGLVTVSDASVILSRVPAVSSTGITRYAMNPKFDIGFSMEDNVWFRNPSIIALLSGDGRIAGSLEKPLITAGIRINSGTLRLATARMRITRGNINVNWTPGRQASGVTVDLHAQTNITTASTLGTQQRYKIILDVSGPLANLEPENISLKSEPSGLSRTQMLAALGHFEDIFGTGETELRDQLRELFSVAVSPRLFDPLESTFIEALGLEDFSIEYGFEQPLAVFLSRRLFDDFYLSYWRIVTGSQTITGATYSMSLSYRIRDWLELSYVTDSRRVNILETSYNRRF
ncbi:MAG: translocation/assembly module TamB domain-containing protein [Armatimonadota bacterium]